MNLEAYVQVRNKLNNLITYTQFLVFLLNFYFLLMFELSSILLYYLLNIILYCRYSMSSHYNSILKAKKILGLYDNVQSKDNRQPLKKPSQRQKRNLSSSSASKSTSKKDFSFCKNNTNNQNSLIKSSSNLKQKKSNNTSFTSLYARETRYDKIMKLKVKPSYNNTKKDDRTKKSVLQNSFSSVGSNRSKSKQNHSRKKISRLDKIMNIKVNKPSVNSTLINYEPRQGSKSVKKEKCESAVKEWKQSQNKIKKSRDQQQKQDRLWKVFERQRELRAKLKKNAQERQFKERRRKQQRFELMVAKEVSKIQKQRQVSKRKSEGFANYIYPIY